MVRGSKGSTSEPIAGSGSRHITAFARKAPVESARNAVYIPAPELSSASTRLKRSAWRASPRKQWPCKQKPSRPRLKKWPQTQACQATPQLEDEEEEVQGQVSVTHNAVAAYEINTSETCKQH